MKAELCEIIIQIFITPNVTG